MAQSVRMSGFMTWLCDCSAAGRVSVGISRIAMNKAARGAPLLLGWVAMASGLGGCLLFTDSVNTPPAIRIDGPERLHRGEQARFSAEVTDATRGARRIEWFDGPGPCPADARAAESAGTPRGGQPAMHLGPAGSKPPGSEPAPPPDLYCVWVFVTDADGARGFASWQVAVVNRTLVVQGPAQVTSGQAVTFTASYDEEPAATALSSLSWANRPSCAEASEAAVEARPERGLVTFRWERAARRSFCVAVLARDEFDVVHLGTLMVPQGQITVSGPPAAIRMVQPELPVGIASGSVTLGIFTDVRLAAADAGDLDPEETLRFTWKLVRPDGRELVPGECPDARPAGSEICFQPDVRGRYRAEVSVTDGTSTTVAPPLELEVNDRPPCIRETDPLFSSARKFFEYYDRARIFRVRSVQDDGDPLPPPTRASQRAFRWSLRKHGEPPGRDGFARRVSATFSDFTIPAREYQPGDRIDVRVEYWDRLDLENPDARDVQNRCDQQAPTCEVVPGSGCYQWITWTVEYL